MSNRLTRGIALLGQVFTSKLRFDTTNTPTLDTKGQLGWDATAQTVSIYLAGVGATATVLHLGQDQYFFVKADETITRGQVVYASGTDGASGHILGKKFLANGLIESKRVLGLAAQSAVKGEFIHVMSFGEMTNINTSDYQAGDILFASTSTAGGLQSAVPVAPNNIVTVALALNSKNNGVLAVRPTFGSKLSQDELVRITDPQNGDVLTYNSALGVWVNQAP
jgi:hypothetical protein